MASLDGRKVLVYERDANQIWQVKASIKLEDVDHGITSSQPVGQPFHRLRLTPPFAVEPLTIAYYSFDSVAIDDDTLMMTYSYSFIGDYRNGLSVYRRDADGVWSEVQHLDPAETGTCALLAPMRLEAGRLFIPGNGIDCRQAGVTVFKETNGDRRWVLDETIVPDNGQPNDAFGHQIALNGSLLAVSSPNANRLDGAVYIFERSGGHWIQQEAITAPAASALNLGNVLAFDNQTLAAAQLPDFSQSGAVYVYDRLTPTSTELLVDAGFELQGAAWDIESPLAKTKCSFDADETIAYEGSCAVQLKGSPLATTRISQVITKGVASGDTLTLGGYVRVKGEVASEVKVTVVYADAQTPKSKLTMVVTSDTGGAYVPLSSLQPALTISVVGVPKKIKVQLTNTSESAKISYDALSLTAASLP
jgi:hypothetical protein